MAATGKTPILLYGSTTPTNAPAAGNLTNSSDGCEIAINVADKNLFFKDSTNAVNTVPIRQSSASSNGWLSSTDWSTFNNKAPAFTYTSNYIPYGQGTTTPTQSANLTFNGTTLSTGSINVTLSTIPANGLYLPSANTLGISSNSGQRAVVTSTGFVKISNSASYANLSGAYHEVNSDQADLAFYIRNTSATGSAFLINCNNSSTSYYYLRGYSASASADKGYWWSDGSWQIAAGKTYGNLSDIKLKENIVDATPKLQDVLKLKIRNYSVKSEVGSKYIGWIAQEFEKVFPSLVDEIPDREIIEKEIIDDDGNVSKQAVEQFTGTTTKRIKESAMIPILTKAIQELSEEIEKLKAQLKGA